MLQLLDRVDTERRTVGQGIDTGRKSELGQFMTPATVARFMASLFTPTAFPSARLLDAGAGIGSLSCAFLERVASGDLPFSRVQACAYEVDAKLRKRLAQNLALYETALPLEISVSSEDFIEAAAVLIQTDAARFTHSILNPPYKKINSASRHRALLRQVGIETVNLYSAFVALALELMTPGGQLVAIIPRSFCNGPYYRPFRDLIFAKAAIKRLHLFDARNRAFKDDAVLQENIIIVLERAALQGEVTVSTSTDDTFADIDSFRFPFDQIVLKDDPERFIHVPTTPEHRQTAAPFICTPLVELGLEVSTGPVVDFRLKEHLRHSPTLQTVPLLYPCHFAGQSILWPQLDAKKPSAILLNDKTLKWLYPSGFYVVVRRFSSKEEKRRIVASVVSPDDFAASMIGFENHLNVFHSGKKGVPEILARGLAVFLNSTLADEQFRRFSGHTQVNATDLRLLKYPSKDILIRLAQWAATQIVFTQESIDKQIQSLTWQNPNT
jgi:tRNA1(Val) A37 N6-methylase TrmN6